MTAARTPRPVSEHPLFPAAVAVWFAVLFGLGCAVLPIGVWERVMVASGIAGLLPPAAPPLGMTARLLIAVTAAVVGLVLGYVLARRVAGTDGMRINAPRKATDDSWDDGVDDREDEGVPAIAPAVADRRPISAREELGPDGFDAPTQAEPAGSAPSAHPAPSALAAPAPDDDAGDAAPAADGAEARDAADDAETLDAADMAKAQAGADVAEAHDAVDDAAAEPGPDPATDPVAERVAPRPLGDQPPPPPPPAPGTPAPGAPAARADTPATPSPFAAPMRDSAWLASADLGELSLAELTERLAFAMAHHRPAGESAAEPANAGSQDAQARASLSPFPFSQPAANAGEDTGAEAEADDAGRANIPRGAIATEEALRAALATLQRMQRAS